MISASVCSSALLFRQPDAQTQTPAANSDSRAVGKVKSISGNVITIATDAGVETTVQVSDSTRLLRVEPGQKDLKSAAPIQLQEIQSGDRVLARGPAGDGKVIQASTVVLMKAADVSAKQEHDREDWKQRGVGGLVSAVDPASQAITISVSGFSGNKSIKIVVAKTTTIRRYAPNSIKFDDAKPATFAEIKLGDQLRARGDRSPDGSEVNAQEIVAGTFRNIAGTVVSSDPAKNTLTVTDLGTKKPVVLAVRGDSQLRKLPLTVAQRIAMRLKGGAAADSLNASSPNPNGTTKPATDQPSPSGGNGRPGGGAPDFQQMLARMPAINLSDLQKGDAVMIVSTEGSGGDLPAAVTLISGVEPILTASPDSGPAANVPRGKQHGGGGAIQ
jgi:hypothetical protein